MGFWYPHIPELTAYYSPVPMGVPSQIIFYHKALCVLCALLHGAYTLPSSSHILIFTDNSNTVNIFNTLHALPAYNFILRSAVDVLLDTNHQLQVRYIPRMAWPIPSCVNSSVCFDLMPRLMYLIYCWGHPKNDHITYQVQATRSQHLDLRTVRL